MSQTRELRAHLAAADLAQAAASYRALQRLLGATGDGGNNGAALRGVALVEARRAWLAAAGDDVRERGAQLLASGIAAQHQADTATALQVFANLGTLRERVNQCAARALQLVASAADRMFDNDTLQADASVLVEQTTAAQGVAGTRRPKR